jgi:ABC-type cobalamin/Fe3+-siderophores transport system ATPase subunit
MTINKIKYIKRIEIKDLWGEYDVHWELNPDVNILIGENGTGKSTILKLVYEKLIKDNNQNITIYFNENNTLLNENIGFIDTFDAPFKVKDIFESSNNTIKTELDLKLDAAINKYVEYQLKKSNEILNENSTKKKAFGKRIYFEETINRLFHEEAVFSKKKVDSNSTRLSFLLESGKTITAYELSSGEKQFLLILLTVLCQDEASSVLLMDEPEISLHLRWQYELINIIRTLNPNCQVIIVTHSPSIHGKGWGDKLFVIKNLLTQTSVAI